MEWDRPSRHSWAYSPWDLVGQITVQEWMVPHDLLDRIVLPESLLTLWETSFFLNLWTRSAPRVHGPSRPSGAFHHSCNGSSLLTVQSRWFLLEFWSESFLPREALWGASPLLEFWSEWSILNLWSKVSILTFWADHPSRPCRVDCSSWSSEVDYPSGPSVVLTVSLIPSPHWPLIAFHTPISHRGLISVH